MPRMSVVAVALLTCAGLSACGTGGPEVSVAGSAGASPARVSGPITVLAAASLAGSFASLGEQFERLHPGTSVTFSFAGSSALAAQISDGAPADVYASASAATMHQVVAAGDASEPTAFATNAMQLAVPPANPGAVDSLADLADVTVALCQPQVPCGATAARVLDQARVTVTPVTLEPDVKSVLSKVILGEVDAGIVYVTDVRAAGDDVRGVEIPSDVNATTEYRIATLTASPNPVASAAFADYVLSPAGRSVLTAAGFGPP